jgi:ABC-type multidrug transport system ATPase subunit
MAIFKEYTIPSEIEDTLKIHYKGSRIRMGDHRIIFVKNGKVVYEETLDKYSKRKGVQFISIGFTQLGSDRSPIYTDSIYIVKRFEQYDRSYGEYNYSVIPISKNGYVRSLTREEAEEEYYKTHDKRGYPIETE